MEFLLYLISCNEVFTTLSEQKHECALLGRSVIRSVAHFFEKNSQPTVDIMLIRMVCQLPMVFILPVTDDQVQDDQVVILTYGTRSPWKTGWQR